MKLGNFITLTIFTFFSIFMILQGYPNESSESLIGGVLFCICLFYWTSYLNRYRLDSNELKKIKYDNRILRHKLEAGSREFELSIEINKLNDKQINALQHLSEGHSELIDIMKQLAQHREDVITAQEEIIKEFRLDIATGILSYNAPDKLEEKSPLDSTIKEVLVQK